VTAPIRFSLDSNILVYTADNRDPGRQAAAIEIMVRAARHDCVLTLQALTEFFHAVTRKRLAPRTDAADQVRDWMDLFIITPGATTGAVLTALDATLAGRFQFYDALLLATAREAGCAAVISEDMADGAELDGLRIIAAFDGQGGLSVQAQNLL
jgi:predicted nucleic acid-binding protein